MSWLDLVILSILLINFIYSLSKGAVREVFSLVALFVGYVAASKTHAYGAAYLLLVLKNPTLARVISFVAVFILVSLLVGFIGRLVHD
ncbi:MAG: CvpA family protein, partial [Candidatus Bathyarchaeia archaeon]